MASEIEIVGTDSPPRYVDPHYDNSMENYDYYSNSESDDSMASEIEIVGTDFLPGYVVFHYDNSMENYDYYSNSESDGTKGTSTRVPCWRWLTTRRSEKNSSKNNDNKGDTKSEDSGSYSSHRGKQEFAALPPDNFSEEQFQGNQFFTNFPERYEVLEYPQKESLSSFILFPANKAVKKSLLVYLWTKQGFLETQGKTREVMASEILHKLTAGNFIIPVIKKGQKVASSFKMHPDVHSEISKFPSCESDKIWACLKESEPLEPENPEKVKILFNINKGYLDFKLERFSKMKNVEVLYLGRWQSWDEHHHIDVTNSEFLKGLKNMEKLSFLSLQGISGIQDLPSSISNLTSLEMLDLRACYNLEKLPKEIRSLKKLTHLDISECYLLDCIPKQLLSLSELQVLKGFVITDTKNKNLCTLSELAGLKKLKKLSVNLNSVTFSADKLEEVLKFKELLKLKITWGAKVSQVKQNKKCKQENNEAKSKAAESANTESLNRQGNAVGEVITKEPNWANKSPQRQDSASGQVNRSSGSKLELQCFPNKALRRWLISTNLPFLKKSRLRLKRAVGKVITREDSALGQVNRSSGSKLKKLELQCFPDEALPSWVIPEKLRSLKKLYIRGGGLRKIDQKGNQNWNVEVLLFRHLKEFMMDWTELIAMFPRLQNLEKFKCPKVTLFPCDCYGIWVNPSKKKPPALPQTTS